MAVPLEFNAEEASKRMLEAFTRTCDAYLAANRPPDEFYFSLDGVVKRIVADREMMHRDWGIHDPIGGHVDLRIGYRHWAKLLLETQTGSEELLYEGTPAEGLRTGDAVTVRGWEGKLVRAPRFLDAVASMNRKITREYPHFGYVRSDERPRRIHQIRVAGPQGIMQYGPEAFSYPTVPLGFEDRYELSVPEFDAP